MTTVELEMIRERDHQAMEILRCQRDWKLEWSALAGWMVLHPTEGLLAANNDPAQALLWAVEETL